MRLTLMLLVALAASPLAVLAQTKCYSVSASGGLNLRSNPTKWGKVVRTVAEGTQLQFGKDRQFLGYTAVQVGADTLWASTEYLREVACRSQPTRPTTPTRPSTPTKSCYSVTASMLNFRWSASSSGGIATTAPEGTSVEYLGKESNGFLLVRANGIQSWASAQYLQKLSKCPSSGVGGACGAYSSAPTQRIRGNSATYTVVKVARSDLSDPSAYNLSPYNKDNTMEVKTACAFSKMKAAALNAGYNIRINSAFRTRERQEYFYNCMLTRRCNNGNLAAQPGTSNHGTGIALDLNVGGGVYSWMRANAHTYGFVRTVPSEDWHWEYRPGSPRSYYT